MLKRLYVDNYNCLVNFELQVDAINLFLGQNGSGKSTVFEVLRKLQSFILGDEKTGVLFKQDNLTRWQKSRVQRFELEVEGNGGTYKYELRIEHDDDRHLTRIKQENLWFDNKPLLKFELGEVQLYRDKPSSVTKYPFDWSNSAVASIHPRDDNKLLTWFKKCVERFVIVQIAPSNMEEDSIEEYSRPSARMENFVSWYRHIYQDQERSIKITLALREILDGFEAFKFQESGDRRVLYLTFSGASSRASYKFSELSDGQKALIALYTMMLYPGEEEFSLLCIDEPENFLALAEIQPWLTMLYDTCSQRKTQAILISHHPELINYLLASPVGYWFDRESNAPARVKRIENEDGGLPVSELIARGWIRA